VSKGHNLTVTLKVDPYVCMSSLGLAVQSYLTSIPHVSILTLCMFSTCVSLLVQRCVLCLIEIHPAAWRTRAEVWKAGTAGSYAQSLRISCHSYTVFCICKVAIFVHVAAKLSKKRYFSYILV